MRLTYLYSLIRKASHSHQKPLSLVPPSPGCCISTCVDSWATTLKGHIICEDPHSEIPPPLSPSHHHHSTLVFLSDLGASRSQTAPEASSTRDSSAAPCMGRWLRAGVQSRALRAGSGQPHRRGLWLPGVSHRSAPQSCGRGQLWPVWQGKPAS